jgi:hypothetical protein
MRRELIIQKPENSVLIDALKFLFVFILPLLS